MLIITGSHCYFTFFETKQIKKQKGLWLWQSLPKEIYSALFMYERHHWGVSWIKKKNIFITLKVLIFSVNKHLSDTLSSMYVRLLHVRQ